MTSVLEAEDISFAYRGASHPVIQGWSASFDAGDTVAIVGPSGRGKSTLLYLLALMLEPTSGVIRFDGVETTALSNAAKARHRANHFGFVFQDAALDPTRSVLDNIIESDLYRLPRNGFGASRARELVEKFEIDIPLERRPGQISGGQAQRIALCRALFAKPRVILADEPTGNLDPHTTEIVIEALLDEARSGATVLMVTHSDMLARRFSREIGL